MIWLDVLNTIVSIGISDKNKPFCFTGLKGYMKYLILSVLILSSGLNSAQGLVKFNGTVTDSLNKPVSDATIISRDLLNSDFKYQILNESGFFSFDFVINRKYIIEIHGMNYKTLFDTIVLNSPSIKNYKLQTNRDELATIIIKARQPVEIKGDTTTYRVEYFKNGRERKARDILNNLPGVEVDRDGNVLVNNKPVTVLKIDGKVFFSGDEKLGVNNIPSDVIDEIEIIQNYDPIPFMKSLRESEQIALNIKLREDRKQFVFGNVDGGMGIDKIYEAKANSFYYSKKLGVNIISGSTNSGRRIFTGLDLIDFEGGDALLLEDSERYAEIVNSDLATQLNNNLFVQNRNNLIAVNAISEFNAKNTFKVYNIFVRDFFFSQNEDFRFYPQFSFQENRNEFLDGDALLNFSKLSWQFRKSATSYWDWNFDLQFFANSPLTEVNSTSSDGFDQNILSNEDKISNRLQMRLEHTAVWSEKSTIEWDTRIKYNNNKIVSDFDYDSPLFDEVIDYQGLTNKISQNSDFSDTGFFTSLKNYYRFSQRYRLESQVFFNSNLSQFSTASFEELLSSSRNLKDQGFGNDNDLFSFEFLPKTDLIYETPIWKFQSGISLGYYNYTLDSRNSDMYNFKSIQILPNLRVKRKFKNNKSLNLFYRTNLIIPNIKLLSNGTRFTSYGSLFAGSSNLLEQIMHSATATFTSIKGFNGLTYSLVANFRYRNNAISRDVDIDNIQLINTVISLDIPALQYGIQFRPTYNINKWRYSLALNYNRNISRDVINGDIQKLEVDNYNYQFKIQNDQKNKLALKGAVQQKWNLFKGLNNSKFNTTNIDISMKYNLLESLFFEGNFEQSYFNNLTTSSSFNYGIANCSLNYTREKSPWSFDLSAFNLLNVRSRFESQLSETVITQSEDFILPFRLLFSVKWDF